MNNLDKIMLKEYNEKINKIERNLLGIVHEGKLNISGFNLLINSILDIYNFINNKESLSNKVIQDKRLPDFRVYYDITGSFIKILEILDNYKIHEFELINSMELSNLIGIFKRDFIDEIKFSDLIFIYRNSLSENEIKISYEILYKMLKVFEIKKFEFRLNEDDYYFGHERKKAIVSIKDI